MKYVAYILVFLKAYRKVVKFKFLYWARKLTLQEGVYYVSIKGLQTVEQVSKTKCTRINYEAVQSMGY